ncbi:MAG: citrate (Si)-synthase [Saprospiraceae bacterium]|nr:citrate (Si)-synthase [Saprospiraceae bacterium]
MDILKSAFKAKFAAKTEELKDLLKANGNMVIDQVKIEQLHGGMRGIKLMLWETSSLDAIEGIRFRGYNIPELKEKLPLINGAKEPLPEGLFWLMLTGDIPTEEQLKWVSKDWANRSEVPPHVFTVLDSIGNSVHPMTQFTIGIMALQSTSIFAKKYDEGIPKSQYWEYMYEDTVNLIARLPRIAAYIYRKCFHNNQHIASDPTLDWSANFAHMMGNNSAEFKDLMRLYLTIHADHEGGNASAHTVHLIGSTLSDAYLSLAGGINALAGPLHGLANQEVMDWIYEMIEGIGTNNPSKDQIKDYVKKTISEGKIVPGYGHAVLRAPDPRFLAQKEFAKVHCANDPLVNIVWNVFEVVPPILEDLGKVKNPWPNVDAHSGALLEYFGIKEHNFYTVLFGVSRAMGVLAQLCWDRAYGLPLERPKSITTEELKEFILQSVI